MKRFSTLLSLLASGLVAAPLSAQAGALYETKFVEAGDIRLQYHDFGGSGLPVIFVQDFHDYFGAALDPSWPPFLARFADGFRVLAPVRRISSPSWMSSASSRPWRPHFLRDESARIDVPALRFFWPVFDEVSMNLRRLDRVAEIAASSSECAPEQEKEYFVALAADEEPSSRHRASRRPGITASTARCSI